MLKTYIIGIGGFIALVVIWIAVQSLWRKVFTEHVVDDDVLAQRSSCGNCGCTTICEKDEEPISNHKENQIA